MLRAGSMDFVGQKQAGQSLGVPFRSFSRESESFEAFRMQFYFIWTSGGQCFDAFGSEMRRDRLYPWLLRPEAGCLRALGELSMLF